MSAALKSRLALLALFVAGCATTGLAGAASAAPLAHSSVGFDPGPLALATDGAGDVYIAESRRGRLRVFGPDGGMIAAWSAAARAVAVDPAGYVYTLGGDRVEKFTTGGSLVGKWGGPGPDRRFGEARGIAVGPDGNVYVADTFRSRIQVFTAAADFVTEWGEHGHEQGQLIYPYGIAVGPDGNVYVADTANDRVQVFTAAGSFIRAWGGTGKARGRFRSPTSVAVGPDGNVYVADGAVSFLYHADLARVQGFTADGQFVTQWRGAPALPGPARPRLFSRTRGETTGRGAVFRFRSRQQDVRFQCSLVGTRVPRRLRRWRPCASPRRYAGLRPGGKVFRVRAVVDVEAGKPSTRRWRIVK